MLDCLISPKFIYLTLYIYGYMGQLNSVLNAGAIYTYALR